MLDEITETPAQQGDLGKTSPIRVFFQLVSSRADGLLVVSVGGIRKEIYLKDGMPTYVSSNMASELFGAYLVQEGAVSSGELDMALAMMPHFGGKLGDTLVGLGLMKPLDVFRLLTRQVRQKLIDVCTWNKGTYTWYPWRENHRESFPLDLDPYEVMGAGAMALPEDVLWRWSESVSSTRPRPTTRFGVRPEQFKVGSLGKSVLEGLNGERTISDLIVRGLGSIDRLDMLRVVFLFMETGLVSDATD
jgi:serine/threonine-protein kinase